MRLIDVYKMAVDCGISADPRGITVPEKQLDKTNKHWVKMEKDDKEVFDLESLTNPYSDTRILFGEPDKEISTIFAGIDVEIGEILLVDRLIQKGEKIDLALSHHPEGYALAGLDEVMHLQEGVLADLGVPINVAEGILADRIGEVKRLIMPGNHNRTVDAARLLNIPLMCVHTPADNLVTKFIAELIEDNKPDTLQDLIKLLQKIPEYKNAAKIKSGPVIVVGNEKRSCGKIFVDMTGGTGGSEDAYEKLAIAGVGTVVAMHISEKHKKKAEKYHINVIIAGHMASDSIGMNLFLDKIERQGIKVISGSGLDRISRN